MKMPFRINGHGSDTVNGSVLGAAQIRDVIASAPEIADADVGGPLDNLDEKIKADPNYVLTEQVIEALSKLSLLEQERILSKDAFRKRRTFFRQIIKGQKGTKDEGAQGQEVVFEEPEPWPNPVQLPELLDEISAFVSAHVIVPDGATDALTVWIAMTYLFQQFETIPQVLITSPEPQCGKTTLLDVLKLLVAKPLMAMNISSPALFRTVSEHRPTLLLDEADKQRHRPAQSGCG